MYGLRETEYIPRKKSSTKKMLEDHKEICDIVYEFIAMPHTTKYCEVVDYGNLHANGNNLRRSFQRVITESGFNHLMDVTIRGNRVFLVWKGEEYEALCDLMCGGIYE